MEQPRSDITSPVPFGSDQSRPREQTHSGYQYPMQLLVTFASYFAAGKLGLAIPFTSGNVSPVWPAAGIGVAAVLLWGFRVAPAIALAAFLVNFLSPIPPLAAAAIGLGNASSAVLAGCLLRRFGDFQISLPRLKDVLRFTILAAVLATASAASVGVAALTLTHTKSWSGYGSAWRIWWLGDAMGVLVVAPVLLAGERLLRVCRGWRTVEILCLSIALLITSAAIFGPWATVRDDVLAFVVFPFVIWAAIRFRVAGAAAVSLLIASVAVWGTAQGFGPFVSNTPIHNAILLQGFIAVTSLTGLILAAVINEREQFGEAFENEKRLLSEIESVKKGLEESAVEQTRELEQKTSQLANQARLLDLANDAILVRDAAGRITYWNDGAQRLYGWNKEEALAGSTQELLQTEFPIDLSDILGMDRWEGELRQTRRDGARIIAASRWTTLRNQNGQAVGWLEINTDISLRKQAEEAARSLSGRILTLQDDERRRIARGLHDSLGQYLTALKMNLERLSRSDDRNSALASECSEILDKCLTETRTISHLLHPPLLDETGFGSATQWYVDGFAQRSGIKVTLNLPPKFGRLPQDIEIVLFRAVQEALTNVHRHSGASLVAIRLTLSPKQILLEIKDNGRGMSQGRLDYALGGEPRAGVGIAGMRERARELGGSINIQSDGTGTRVLVRIPFVEEAAID